MALAVPLMAAAPMARSQTPPAGASLTVLVVGDSLAAEYGIARGTGWVPLLAARVHERYPKYQVVNASISGDTTSGGVSRLPPLLAEHKPAVVVLELGANDALRGLPIRMTHDNLESMVRSAQAAGARPVLVGMQIPPNYGRQYTEQFKAVFGDVARDGKAALVPFFMAGIADKPTLFQADGLHPNENAQQQLLENVWPAIESQLKK
jgi:acyl-CoA thioesterase-1